MMNGRETGLIGFGERTTPQSRIAFIDGATLSRECFVRVVESEHQGVVVTAFRSVAEWKVASRGKHFDIIVCNIGDGDPSDVAVSADLRELVQESSPLPVIVLAETDDIYNMMQVVNCGVWSCIPTSVGVDSMVHAMRLMSVGGVFLPATGVRKDASAVSWPREAEGPTSMFTPRQQAVAEALRQGKANKAIAHELDICENTVKSHVRTIMRKLKANNRTEVAFKLNAVVPDRRKDRERMGFTKTAHTSGRST